MDSNKLLLTAVPLIVWLGVFIYLLIVDRKLARLETGAEEDDL